jgi:hypothetical protein
LGTWLHAFEIRFLLSDGARSPFGETESAPKGTRLMIVPDGHVLLANLIIGPKGAPLDLPLPVEFLGGEPLWRARLRDGRIAVLVGRVLALDEENRGHIRRLREEGPVVTVKQMSDLRYAEVHRLDWSAGGNIVLVVPRGDEAFRSEEDDAAQAAKSRPIAHTFRYQSAASKVEILAPDSRVVAVIELPTIDQQIELLKGHPKIAELASLTMRLETSNLVSGGKFTASPRKLTCNPSLDGVVLGEWTNDIRASFDGICFSAEVCQTSHAIQNRHLPSPISQLGDDEEIVRAVPSDNLKISATLEDPSASVKFFGRYTWRDRRDVASRLMPDPRRTLIFGIMLAPIIAGILFWWFNPLT